MATKRRLVIVLDSEDYSRLTEVAADQDRAPWDQARHLVRQAIRAEQAGDERNQRRPEEVRA